MTEFKFRFVKNGQAANILSKQGRVTADGLQLGDATIPFGDIGDTTTRDNRLVVTVTRALEGELAKHTTDPSFVVLEVYKLKALELERIVDRASASVLLERNKQRLIKEDKAHLFRTANCPECQATIDLSELPKTTYVYCRFCESVFTDGRVTKGTEYRCCDQCGLFDRVRDYTEFYFYFLVVVYGFSYKRRHLCDSCAGALFWKVFLINFIFVLGVFPALWLKIKSATGRAVDYKELPDANKHAKAGRMQEASPLYATLHERLAGHPGVYMNEGIGYVKANAPDEAAARFQRSLQQCSNYLPTVQLLKS